MAETLEIFLVATPGLEAPLAAEARELGYAPEITGAGVTVRGGWPDVWRLNLWLRGATRVLVRIGAFRVLHLAQLDKRARKFPWAETLRPDVPLRVEVSCRKSRIYHAGAATQRIERALVEAFGATLADDAALVVKVRIEDDLCTISLDTTGESLHKRGHKEAVGKAPLRETMAAMFLREAGYRGTEPVLDPMCGSGTLPIEAAEIAAGLAPGRSRSFAFENLASFDGQAWAAMRAAVSRPTDLRFYGSDRDQGAVASARANAERAGVADLCGFTHAAVSDLTQPEGPPGLVIINPPYGARIGNKGALYGLHAAIGETLRSRFAGWRAAIITSEGGLARATGLPFLPPGPIVAHGGLKVRLWQTAPLS
ncbi:MAG: class I SAM-dependent RNA methyltransferase [Paracoccus sp. (in: a-proteobacteria)]|uniref:THUMP domain-containing class I SAM-dependent RNA methyltransferase n=1 Tax=Paracoccus sp. TaxID=267 RepID=UPI0026DF7149|nr:class I SAM-dependent RNA methyltransferase [Paracoccus sp. (in: a-proteobacteria)]MDO5621313.1 class I SAM-dependent RNA methyltransferase [Paracoccus sp. (in: a-proteobacteria)]